MSFHLSSSSSSDAEEEELFCLNTNENNNKSDILSSSSIDDNEEEDDEEEDYEGGVIEWEDGDDAQSLSSSENKDEQQHQHSSSSNSHNIPNNRIVVFNKRTGMKKKKRKRITNKQLLLLSGFNNSVSPKLISNLHRVHLLCHVGYGFHVSSSVNEDERLCRALSLIPRDLHDVNLPTLRHIRNLMGWYRDIMFSGNINGGANLSPVRDDLSTLTLLSKGLLEPNDHTIIFLTLCRALGWRARYLYNIATNPEDLLQRNVSEDHPILRHSLKEDLVNYLHNFRKVVDTSKVVDLTTSTANRTQSVSTVQNNDGSVLKHENNIFAWLEVQLLEKKWVHVDINLQLVDRPREVEFHNYLLSKVSDKTNSKKSKNIQPRSGKKRRMKKARPVAYVLGIEHLFSKGSVRLVDVTPRYSNHFDKSLKLRDDLKVIRKSRSASKQGHLLFIDENHSDWFKMSLKQVSTHFLKTRKRKLNTSVDKSSTINRNTDMKRSRVDSSSLQGKELSLCRKGISEKDAIALSSDSEDSVDVEVAELVASKEEPLPKSKSAYKASTTYILPSLLNQTQIIKPNARSRGLFKGENVFYRIDVEELHTGSKWKRLGRKVLDDQISKPAKSLENKRKKKDKFEKLDSYLKEDEATVAALLSSTNDNDLLFNAKNMKHLYGSWQTEKWSPPYVLPHENIPVNQYNNIELDLLNPGLVHINIRGAAKLAKKLGIAYAPCMMGYDGPNPRISGIVVHEPNEGILTDALTETESKLLEDEHKKRRKAIYGRWRKLVKGLLIRDRLEKEYNDDDW